MARRGRLLTQSLAQGAKASQGPDRVGLLGTSSGPEVAIHRAGLVRLGLLRHEPRRRAPQRPAAHIARAPEMAREMTSRWISEVPSKMV
jgi:hypothetical protein